MKYFFSTLFHTGNCLIIVLFIAACSQKTNTEKAEADTLEIKHELRQLEQKWLEYEFALDTASIARMLDNSFISLSGTGSSDKQSELKGIFTNISNMYKDSIVLDSFRIEEPFLTKLYGNTAITIFICHSYKRNRGRTIEKRTRFYDVWVRKEEGWKAVSSQATVLSEQ